MMNEQDLEQIQQELPKRLGLKKHKRYPAELWGVLLSQRDSRESLESLARGNEEEWDTVTFHARLAYQSWEKGGSRQLAPQEVQVSERAAEQLGDYATERS